MPAPEMKILITKVTSDDDDKVCSSGPDVEKTFMLSLTEHGSLTTQKHQMEFSSLNHQT